MPRQAPLRLGMIASAGGAVLDAMVPPLSGRCEISVVTDRECGAEEVAARHGLPCRRIEFRDRTQFSSLAADHLAGVDGVLLHFSRLVAAELYAVLPTFSVHPSLLPAFPGMGAVAAAKRSGVRVLGASLFVVDGSIDGGAILAQCAMSVQPEDTLEDMNNISYLQKTYLSLLLVESWLDGRLILDDPPGPRIVDLPERSGVWSPCLDAGPSLTWMRELITRHRPWVTL